MATFLDGKEENKVLRIGMHEKLQTAVPPFEKFNSKFFLFEQV